VPLKTNRYCGRHLGTGTIASGIQAVIKDATDVINIKIDYRLHDVSVVVSNKEREYYHTSTGWP